MSAVVAADPTLAEWARRRNALIRLRAASPTQLAALWTFYREHPADFLQDWGTCHEPRNAALGLPTLLPMLLWLRQRELVDWIHARWLRGEYGLLLKARDSGASWISVGFGIWACLFHPGSAIGFGSRKTEYVDASPKSLFAKARFFLQHLPREFLGGFDLNKHAMYMRLLFPNGSTMTGEGGTNLGRGDRTSLYFIDEAAYLENPAEVDAALSQTTRCRIDISTPNGRTGPFAEKYLSGNFPTFLFSWRDHPGRDDAWLEEQRRILPPHVVAQEILADFNASVEGILIPREWAEAAVGAHTKLGFTPEGDTFAGFDIANTGDRCAMALRRGPLLQHLESWSGANSDLYLSTVRAFDTCDRFGHHGFSYDSSGLGASVGGDAARINEARAIASQKQLLVEPYNGGAAVYDSEGETVPGRKNRDTFLNRKAQSWWALRQRFQLTHRAVVGGVRPFDPDALISIDPALPELNELLAELSQPTFSLNGAGKMQIDKYGGGRSPDRADAVCIAFQPEISSLATWMKLARLEAAEQAAAAAAR